MLALLLCGCLYAAPAAATEEPPLDTLLSAIENSLSQGKPERAHDMLEQARRRAPQEGRVDYFQGLYHAQRNEPEPAITAFMAAIQKKPDLRDAHINLALQYDVLGRYNDAAAVYESAAKRFPKDNELLEEWGTSLILRKKFAEAEKVLKRALELKPADPQITADIAYSILRQSRAKEAVALYETAFKAAAGKRTEWNLAEVRKQYADALANSGDLPKAEAVYTELINANAATLEVYQHRMKVREARGDRTGAMADKKELERRKKP